MRVQNNKFYMVPNLSIYCCGRTLRESCWRTGQNNQYNPARRN